MQNFICISLIRPQHTALGRSVARGSKGVTISPGAESLFGRRITVGRAELLQGRRILGVRPNSITINFFNIVSLFPKDLRLDHGAPNLRLATGASNLVTPLALEKEN